MDGLSYGPGVFRSSAQQLVALGTGGIALAPSIPSPSPFKNTLFIEKSLKPLEQEKIQSVLDSLHESGIVVVSTPVNDICPENFQEMLQSLGAISQEHNKEGTFCWTINAKLSTTARSHTSEAFLVHTDASFEDSPPRYFALAIKHQDCTGAGETSLASIEDAVSQLTEVQKKILRTTVVKWTIPPEFNRGIPYVKGTVLFSNTMGRFRKDIIDTSDLTKENADLFWDAYNTIDNILANSCEKNKSVLPEGSIVIIDNWKYVHSRKQFNDLNRLLYRVRFNLSSPQTPLINKKMLLAKLTPEILSKSGLYWSPSGGTTSRGYSCDFCLPASYEENNKLRRDMSELFKIHGAFDGRVAVNLMSAGHLYRGLEVFQDLFTRGGLTELPLGFEISDEELFANINRFDASILCGYPSRIIQFCVYLKNNNLILPLTSIIYGGERFFDYQKEFCRKVLPQAKFYGVYGSSETGVFACTKADETAYQYCPDGIQIEVLDENDMPTNGVGRLVITNKYRKYFPIQRFDIRDIGKKTGLFEFTVDGREEMASLFPMGDYNLDFFVIFNNCFEHLQQGIVSAQIWIHPAKDDFKVVTSLYFHSTEPVNQEQRDIIKQRFFKDIPLYAADVVQVDNLNDLKRSTRSGKLLQFVDLR
ncbi:hypothetical protein HDV02_002877 [Globomyces sp. JEL0801]|nr:hypothetical protein HDV02_002877 [Globomyces sp. JEL0801]